MPALGADKINAARSISRFKPCERVNTPARSKDCLCFAKACSAGNALKSANTLAT